MSSSLSRITLTSRRGIYLSDLRMSATYGGLLEGVPTAHVNDHIVDYRLRHARETYPDRPVHLIPPERTETGRTGFRGRPVEYLPPVVCLGSFDSTEIDPAHNDGWWTSLLVVVWFQQVAEVPSDTAGLPALRELAWEELARDFED
ncbi:hypothetical protein [Streptomyces sp. NPDC021020]|uniref:hypothetical protein n=1 Tax=Streptomyces sp. NPDC021020 TaxID=3365109 RepID=UPI0037A73B32